MQIKIDNDFLSLFPEANIQVLAIDDLAQLKEKNVELWKDRAQEHVRSSKIQSELLAQESEFREWREAYSKFGLRPSKFRSSVEQLWKRALKGDMVETPVALVNLYCYTSIISHVPLGGYDLDRVVGDIVVRRSREGETFLGIGEKQETIVPPGVVIYADDSRVLCFGWNHRDSEHACLRHETRRAVFFADSASTQSRQRAAQSLDLLQQALEEFGCRGAFRGIVDSENQELSIN